jgi:hypothetical protein
MTIETPKFRERSPDPGCPWTIYRQAVDNSGAHLAPQFVHMWVHSDDHSAQRGFGRIHHRRIWLSSAWISERREASSFSFTTIFWTAEMTVV